MQNVLPPLELGIVVKPVFTQHRENIIIDHRMKPLICADLLTAEIAVPNTETFSKRAVGGDFFVQLFYSRHEFIQGVVVQPILVLDKALRIKAGVWSAPDCCAKTRVSKCRLSA